MSQILGIIWPAGSIIAWLAGAAMLQTKARKMPIDLPLNISIFMLTVATFHLIAYTQIATVGEDSTVQAMPFFDVFIIFAALIVIKSRVQSLGLVFKMFILILAGSISFWLWYINAIGGLLPK